MSSSAAPPGSDLRAQAVAAIEVGPRVGLLPRAPMAPATAVAEAAAVVAAEAAAAVAAEAAVVEAAVAAGAADPAFWPLVG
ncbi:hypothetical protein ACWZHB_27535 [Nocardia sp. FBN12]|uniref:hypothetical protein n=1 Tax=Nocardia sp. FBN12 TaxID=3419766 RepID=UPI003D04628F